MRDGANRDVDLAHESCVPGAHAPLSCAHRAGSAEARYEDPDALRVVLEAPDEVAAHAPLLEAEVASVSASGEPIDVPARRPFTRPLRLRLVAYVRGQRTPALRHRRG